MKEHESQQLVLKIIAFGFILSFACNIFSLFFPPDMNQNPPVYQKATLILQALGVAFIIFSSTLLGLKLTEAKKTIAAGGFTMFAIANGVGLVIFFEMRQFTVEEYEKVYDIYTSAVALYLPASILIIFYDDVPKWLRIGPLVFSFFMLVSLVLYYAGYREYNIMDQISFVGYLAMMLVTLFWGIYIWRMASEIKET